MHDRFASIRAAAGCALTPLALCLSQVAWAQTPPAAAGGSAELSAVTVIGTVDRLQSLDFYAPNSTAVISRDDIDTMGSRKLDQALQYQAGILAEPFGSDNKVDWFKIRGFDASVSVDGTPTTPNGFFVPKTEVFGLESIEVVKGANSLVFGAVNSGGVVNLLTKRPKKQQALGISAELGNRGKLGLGVDYNGVANADGSVYYRLVAQARKEDGMQRETEMKSYYFAPSLTVDFSKRTALTLLASVQREDGTPTNGFMPGYGSLIDTPYGRINRRTNLGEPGVDSLERTQITAGWQLRHEIAKDWDFTQNYKFSRVNLDQTNVFAYAPDPNNDRRALRGYSFTQGNMRNHFIDNRVSGRLRLDGVTLSPTVGIDYLKSDTEGQNNGFGAVPPIDMFAPVYGSAIALSGAPYEQRLRQLGLYASAQAQIGDSWNFTAGLRHDRAKNSIPNGYDVSHNSLNAGVMYVTEAGIAPYLSYSESFRPMVGSDASGTPYVPYEGKQAEVGVKLEPEWLDGGTMTLAYFKLKEKNALVSDASNVQRQIGERSNRGIEWQGDFKVLRDTAIKASYTHNDSEQDLSATRTVRTPMIPRQQASLWVNQRFALPAGGLTAGLGVRYNGSTVDEATFPGRKVASYTLLDLMLRYDIDRSWSLQLNARNLTDKTYLSGCDFYCYYGGNRTVDLQLQYRM